MPLFVRLLPVLASTASATLAATALHSISPLMYLEIPPREVMQWLKSYIWSGLIVAAVLGATTIASGCYNWRKLNEVSAEDSSSLYGAGAMITVAHFVYGVFVGSP